jgi:hypothetical protein
MAFVKFTETGRSFVARVSISPRGMISLNDGARKKFNVDQYEYVVLYYDGERKLVGLELAKDGSTEGAVRIRLRPTGADFGAKSFVDFFEIAPKNTTMYNVQAGQQENWIIIDLNTGRERKGALAD